MSRSAVAVQLPLLVREWQLTARPRNNVVGGIGRASLSLFQRTSGPVVECRSNTSPPSEGFPVKRLLPALAACAIVLGVTAAARAADLPAVPLDDKDRPAQGSDIAWMLVATSLVLLMVPGLALFYGGMVRRKNALGTMMHSMAALSVVGLQWVLVGYCLSFGASLGGWVGWSPELLGLSDPVLFD